jgi:hypothetical protein
MPFSFGLNFRLFPLGLDASTAPVCYALDGAGFNTHWPTPFPISQGWFNMVALGWCSI